MHEFFKPARRKIGGWLLFGVLLMAALWWRGINIVDETWVLRNNKFYTLSLGDGGVSWEVADYLALDPIVRMMQQFQQLRWNTRPARLDDMFLPEGSPPKEPGGILGFRYSEEITEDDLGKHRIALWKVPYWSIMMTMTAISVWLLFKAPKKTVASQVPSAG